jgi:hypothetical protein
MTISNMDYEFKLSAFPDGLALVTGSGAYAVTISVNDGVAAIEGAQVRLTRGVTTYTAPTRANGQALFSVDAGTWTISITRPGYSFTPIDLVIAGNQAQTYSMSSILIPTSEPGFITAYTRCYVDGVLTEGVDVYMQLLDLPGTGREVDGTIDMAVSDANGVAYFSDRFPSGTYWLRGGRSGAWVRVEMPSSGYTYALPNVVGRP